MLKQLNELKSHIYDLDVYVKKYGYGSIIVNKKTKEIIDYVMENLNE